jgi:hypothetical protein
MRSLPAVGDEGKIAYFFRDANSYVTNQRDQAFLKARRRPHRADQPDGWRLLTDPTSRRRNDRPLRR